MDGLHPRALLEKIQRTCCRSSTDSEVRAISYTTGQSIPKPITIHSGHFRANQHNEAKVKGRHNVMRLRSGARYGERALSGEDFRLDNTLRRQRVCRRLLRKVLCAAEDYTRIMCCQPLLYDFVFLY
eukprot:474847_1